MAGYNLTDEQAAVLKNYVNGYLSELNPYISSMKAMQKNSPGIAAGKASGVPSLAEYAKSQNKEGLYNLNDKDQAEAVYKKLVNISGDIADSKGEFDTWASSSSDAPALDTGDDDAAENNSPQKQADTEKNRQSGASPATAGAAQVRGSYSDNAAERQAKKAAMVEAYNKIMANEYSGWGEFYSLMSDVVGGNEAIAAETKSASNLASYLSSTYRPTLAGVAIEKQFKKEANRQAKLSAKIYGMMSNAEAHMAKDIERASKHVGLAGIKNKIEDTGKAEAKENNGNINKAKSGAKKAGLLAGLGLWLANIRGPKKANEIAEAAGSAAAKLENGPPKTAEEVKDQWQNTIKPDYADGIAALNEGFAKMIAQVTAMAETHAKQSEALMAQITELTKEKPAQPGYGGTVVVLGGEKADRLVEQLGQQLNTGTPAAEDINTQDIDTEIPAAEAIDTQGIDTETPAAETASMQNIDTETPAAEAVDTQDIDTETPAAEAADTQDIDTETPAAEAVDEQASESEDQDPEETDAEENYDDLFDDDDYGYDDFGGLVPEGDSAAATQPPGTQASSDNMATQPSDTQASDNNIRAASAKEAHTVAANLKNMADGYDDVDETERLEEYT